MKNKIFLIIYIILAAALAYWVYPIVKDRYFSPTIELEGSGRDLDQDQSNLHEVDLEKIEEGKDIDDGEEENSENETDEFLEITNEDCENNCVEFEEENDLVYCRQVCGLFSSVIVDENNCKNFSDLEKDYCLKDLAITNKDFETCQEIKDVNIRKTCQNRITEEILNGNSAPVQN